MHSIASLYINTEEVLTEFFNREPEFGEYIGEGDDLTLQTANYDPYDLFCFNTLLRERIYPQYHKLEPVGRGQRSYLAVILYKGMDVVPITKEMKKELEDHVSYCHNRRDDKCLLFSTKRNIWYNNVCLPSFWMKSVIKDIEIPDDVEYRSGTLRSLEKVIEDGIVYITIDRDTMFTKLYEDLKHLILDQLYNLYISGSIVTQDLEFIREWDLLNVRGNLYTAKWTHYLIESCKTTFLLDAISKNQLVEKNGEYYTPKSLRELCDL